MKNLKNITIIAASVMVSGCDRVTADDINRAPAAGIYTGALSVWTDPTTGCHYYAYAVRGGKSLTIRHRADGLPDCPASGTETRQGGDQNGLRAQHDGPAPQADAQGNGS